MEPTLDPQTPVTEKPNPFTTVTPLSKYLAMALFITLPFLGGYIGHVFAPEKVVEVEVLKTSDEEPAIEQKDYEAKEIGQIAVEEFTCATKLAVNCFRVVDQNAGLVLIDNLDELFVEQLPSFEVNGNVRLLELEYISQSQSKAYFITGIPDSDGCCSLVTFDFQSKLFSPVPQMYSGAASTIFTTDNRFLVSVSNFPSNVLTVYDLEYGVPVFTELVEGSLASSHCEMPSLVTDFKLNYQANVLTYGVYELPTKRDCGGEIRSLLEYRQLDLNQFYDNPRH